MNSTPPQQQIDFAIRSYEFRLEPGTIRCSNCKYNNKPDSGEKISTCLLLDIVIADSKKSTCPLFSMKNEYAPDTVSPPCETLKEIFEERLLTPEVFAAYSGMSVDLVLRLLSGDAPITLSIAATLSRMFGATAQFWINRQEDYDQWVKQREDAN